MESTCRSVSGVKRGACAVTCAAITNGSRVSGISIRPAAPAERWNDLHVVAVARFRSAPSEEREHGQLPGAATGWSSGRGLARLYAVE